MKIILICILLVIIYAGEDYYVMLGFKQNADEKEIRKAFKKASLKFHPDKNPDNKEEAGQRYMKIAYAYEVLTDPEKSEIYDKRGEKGLKYYRK